MTKNRYRILSLFLVIASPAAAQAPSLPYTYQASKSTPVGDGSLSSQPMPMKCISGCGAGGGAVGPTNAASTDISGTVTVGGTYQTAAAASTTRLNCTIQNPSSATESLKIKLGTMAQPYEIGAGQSWSALNGVVVGREIITLTAATAGHAFAGNCQ
jgi:hypothetical protein